MSSFTRFDAPMLVQYDDKASALLGADHWRVAQPFRFYLGEKDSDRWVYVPAGYLTDGASVPRMFWNVVPPWGQYGQAAVVHDIVCEYLSITIDGKPVPVSRARCDAILLEAMEVLGVPSWKRYPIYWAVCAYRVVARVDQPSRDALKMQLEAEWLR